MKKIININLSGRVIPIEDTAYDSLQRYIESLRRYFAAEEGRDEIINDIEGRIAELMNDKIKKGSTCVTEYDIEEIISAMGRVEDFEAAAGEPIGSSYTTTNSSYSTGSSSYQQQQQGTRQRFTGRLHRDADDKIIGGVCAGVANYVNIDPAIVRLVFAIITFGGFGFGFLLYILLWIILPASSLNRYHGKRFFRNPDDRVLGGVAGGLAAYFNKNAWTIRAIFAAPLLINIVFSVLSSIFSGFDHRIDVFPNVFFGSFTGTFILTYIILWIVLPEAKTPYDKMEMRGEKVDINSIKQNVQEGMENFGTRAKAWGEEVKTSAQTWGTRASEFANTRGRSFAYEAASVARPAATGIGHVIGVIFKAFFLFFAGVIAFALFVMLLVFTFGGVAQPVNAFLVDGFWQKTFMWSTVILFLAVPLIGIITWIIRRVMNVRSQNRYLGWIFGGLWTLGWVSLALFVSSMVKDFRYTEQTEANIPVARPAMNKMIVEVPGSPIRYSGNFGWINDDDGDGMGWDITDDSLKVANIRITVRQSDDSFYHVTLRRFSAGNNRARALQRAENIQYTVSSQDSVLLLGTGFGLGTKDKFRGQKVLVEIKVPTGKQIRFDNTVADKFNPFDVRIGETENRNRRRNWNRRNWDFEWDNSWYYDWSPDTDYYMTADGKLKEVGIPDVENKETPEDRRDTIIRTEQTLKMRLQKEEQMNRQPAVITQKKETGGDLPAPLPMPFVNTLF